MGRGLKVATKWASLAVMVALTGCSLIETEESAAPVAVASDQPFPPQLEQGLDRAAVAGDPAAIGALAGAHPACGERIVAFAVTAHPPKAASFAAAAAQAQPDMAPQLAAAAATANPTAAVEIAG